MKETFQEDSTSGQIVSLVMKDWLGILFSTLALTLSSMSFYYTELRIEDIVLARIIDLDLGSKNGNEKTIETKFAFVNAGNRPAIILGADYRYAARPNLEDGGFGGPAIPLGESFPLYLGPREMRLVILQTPISNAIDNFEHGSPNVNDYQDREPQLKPVPDIAEPRRRFYCGFYLRALDSGGADHEAWSGMLIQFDVTKTGWQAMGFVNRSGSTPNLVLFREQSFLR